MLKRALISIAFAFVAFVATPAAANAAGQVTAAADSGSTVSFLVIWAAVGALVFAVAMIVVLGNVRRQRAGARSNGLPGAVRTATA